MRADVFLENDSHGMSLLSSSVVDRAIAAGLGNDAPFVEAHEVVLGLLVGDDSFIARVVVNEPLTNAEREEWIAHYRTWLSVPCGRLLVCGGFDPDVLGWWKEGKTKGVRDIAVPAGKYLVDVYTYLHSMNGRVILSDVLEVKLGEWFRQDHAGRSFPAWVAGELAVFPEFDPGHEAEWKKLADSVAKGTLAVEKAPLDWVSFVVHLQAFDPKATLDEPEEGTWFGAGQGMRRPARFPMGISSTAEDPEYREALKELFPKKPPPPPEPVEVFSQIGSLPLVPVTGGPVVVPAAAIAQVYRLGWFTAAFVHPEWRLEGPGVKHLAQFFVDPALPAVVGDALHVRFAGGVPFNILNRVKKVGPEPWTHVPAGTTLELVTRSLQEKDASLGGPGFTRYRGKIEVKDGQRVWAITEAFPPVSADVLRRAIALSAASESDHRLVLTSEDEAQRVLDAFRARSLGKIYPWIRLERKGAELRLSQVEENTIQFIAAAGFRLMFSTVWPHEPEPEDEDEGGEEDE
jgi:hypothetical protein